jgi:23S rRNA pseudouridine1911/1915/1917 synthase
LYWAFVWGNPQDDEGTIRGHIGRHPKNRMQMSFMRTEARETCCYALQGLERFKYMTWVECKLEAGRTHQIRAHFKHIGHTLFNDERYEGHTPLRVNLPKYKQFIKNVLRFSQTCSSCAHPGIYTPNYQKGIIF